jgi:hypothetical protein
MSALLDQATALEVTRARWDVRDLVHSRRALVWAFIAIHLAFLAALTPTIFTGNVLGDLPLYRDWAISGIDASQWPGIAFPWVYPVGALAPITIAEIAGPVFYQFVWFAMTAVLNAASVYFLLRAAPAGRNRYVGAWWWMLFLLILSPVALLRLEGIAAPLVIIGLSVLARRPFVASIILTAATWIKVWPVAILLAILATGRRWFTIVAGGALVTAVIVVTVYALGGIQYIASFVALQSDRGLQLEAPISTAWVWMSDLGIGRAFIWQDLIINTEQVSGPGDQVAAAIMDPAMLLAVCSIVALIVWARHRGVAATQLVLFGSLALVTALVVFNKVGSPQYTLWIAPIVAVGVCTSWAAWRTPAILMLAIGFITTLIFPVLYMPLENGNLAAAALLTARNLLLVVLLIWAVRELFHLARSARAPAQDPLRRELTPSP